MLWQQVNWYLGTQNDKPNNVWSDLKHLGICERSSDANRHECIMHWISFVVSVPSSVVSVPWLFFLVKMFSHRLAQVWVRTHIITSMFHAHCVFLWLLRHFHSLLLPHLLSDHLVLPSARQLHLPGCGGQIPCATPLRNLAPWPRTSLPQTRQMTCTLFPETRGSEQWWNSANCCSLAAAECSGIRCTFWTGGDHGGVVWAQEIVVVVGDIDGCVLRDPKSWRSWRAWTHNLCL